MKNRKLIWLGCTILLLAARPLLAQDGCDQSPENPTILLGLVGGAGALYSTLRAKARARQK
jgi:XrtJ-associated TM-motif-TM protein